MKKTLILPSATLVAGIALAPEGALAQHGGGGFGGGGISHPGFGGGYAHPGIYRGGYYGLGHGSYYGGGYGYGATTAAGARPGC